MVRPLACSGEDATTLGSVGGEKTARPRVGKGDRQNEYEFADFRSRTNIKKLQYRLHLKPHGICLFVELYLKYTPLDPQFGPSRRNRITHWLKHIVRLQRGRRLRQVSRPNLLFFGEIQS